MLLKPGTGTRHPASPHGHPEAGIHMCCASHWDRPTHHFARATMAAFAVWSVPTRFPSAGLAHDQFVPSGVARLSRVARRPHWPELVTELKVTQTIHDRYQTKARGTLARWAWAA